MRTRKEVGEDLRKILPGNTAQQQAVIMTMATMEILLDIRDLLTEIKSNHANVETKENTTTNVSSSSINHP